MTGRARAPGARSTIRRLASAGSGALAVVTVGLLLAGCSPSDMSGPGTPPSPPEATRSFALGFTPWPYAATTEAQADVYERLLANGDFVAHHIDGGVPWPEAHAGDPYPAGVEAELLGRETRTPDGTPVYLAITPLSSPRDGLAEYWGESKGLPRPGPWANRTFDDPEVVDAYANWALDLVDRFEPDWLNYGIEMTELAVNGTAEEIDALVALAAEVHARVRAAHPSLPIFVSGGLKTPGSTDAAAVEALWRRLLPHSDYVGVSGYPFVFFDHADKGDPDNLPADWLAQATDLAAGKPLAIAETGWIAERLRIPQFGVDVPATPADQVAYVERLLSESDALDAELVVWFFTVDFDVLWVETLGSDPVARIWRDTGLWDEDLVARPGLAAWQEWLARPIR